MKILQKYNWLFVSGLTILIGCDNGTRRALDQDNAVKEDPIATNRLDEQSSKSPSAQPGSKRLPSSTHLAVSPGQRLVGRWDWDSTSYRVETERKLARQDAKTSALGRELMESVINDGPFFEFTPDGKLLTGTGDSKGIPIRWELVAEQGNVIRIRVAGLNGGLDDVTITFANPNRMVWYQPNHRLNPNSRMPYVRKSNTK